MKVLLNLYNSRTHLSYSQNIRFFRTSIALFDEVKVVACPAFPESVAEGDVKYVLLYIGVPILILIISNSLLSNINFYHLVITRMYNHKIP